MRSLAMLDIPYLLQCQNNSMRGTKLVGFLLGEVTKPDFFSKINLRDRTDALVVIDLIGIVTENDTYYAKGKVLTTISRSILSSASSDGRLLVELSNGLLKTNSFRFPSFVSYLGWRRNRENNWDVFRADCSPATKSAYPEFVAVASEAFRNNWEISYPVKVDEGYTEACDGFEFTFVTPKSKSPSKSEPPQTTTNLGVSADSDVQELVTNRGLQQQQAMINSERGYSRNSLAPLPKNAILLERALATAEEKYALFKQDLFSLDFPFVDIENSLNFMASQLQTSWSNRHGEYTGRALFKAALESVLFDASSGEVERVLDSKGFTLLHLWASPNTGDPDEKDKVLKGIVTYREAIYFNIFGRLLGLKGSLSEAEAALAKEGFSLLGVMKLNPYILGFFDPDLTLTDLDRLAFCFGTNLNNAEVIRLRNVVYMHAYMLGYNSPLGDSTILKRDVVLRSIVSGLLIDSKAYASLVSSGTLLSPEALDSLKFYFDPSISEANFKLPAASFRPLSSKKTSHYILPTKSSNTAVLQDYLNSGLGVILDFDGVSYLADYFYAYKENYIYTRLRKMAELPSDPIEPAVLDRCLEDFRALKSKELGIDFNFEERQEQAVRLVSERVMCVTGPAGSGKTTTAEALVFAIKSIFNLSDEDIFFCAPTNRAANRLKEVVKRKTRTFNSLFRVGGSKNLVLPSEVETRNNIRALVSDEFSMVTVNLFYEVLIQLPDKARLYFLGDIEQLAPIGAGKPFANILSFLPTVQLNVSKRASKNSGITANAEKVIYRSDGVVEPLEDTKDFRLLHEPSPDDAVRTLLSMVAYHVRGNTSPPAEPLELEDPSNFTPDDIQVISPLNIGVWGTRNLNQLLQDIFNPLRYPDKSLVFAPSETNRVEFRLGDRVMHIKDNDSERIRLTQCGKASFALESSKGISNAEQGKVIGFYRPSELDFSNNTEDDAAKLRDAYSGRDNTIFIGVRYETFDEDSAEVINFVVLYRAFIQTEDEEHYYVTGADLWTLTLAYALTSFKLQGSEAKLVFCILLPFKGSFINRNNIYVSISRAKVGCYVTGDVLGADSCLTKGRKIKQLALRSTIMDHLHKGV